MRKIVDKKVKMDDFQSGLMQRFFGGLQSNGQSLKIYEIGEVQDPFLEKAKQNTDGSVNDLVNDNESKSTTSYMSPRNA